MSSAAAAAASAFSHFRLLTGSQKYYQSYPETSHIDAPHHFLDILWKILFLEIFSYIVLEVLTSLFALLVKDNIYTLNIEHDRIKTNLNILSSCRGGFLLIYIWSMIWLDPLKNHVEDDVAQIWNWVSHWKQRAGWDSSITSFFIQLPTNSFTHRWVQNIENVKINRKYCLLFLWGEFMDKHCWR